MNSSKASLLCMALTLCWGLGACSEDAGAPETATSNGAPTAVSDDGQVATRSMNLDSWLESAKVIGSDGAPDDEFGGSVAVSGDIAVVAARHADAPAHQSGAVYVYERDEGGADNWGEVKKLTPSDGTVTGWYGSSVSASGDVIVVGAVDDAANNKYGAAYVYERDEGGADNWGEVKKLVASDGGFGDLFGFSVSISEDTVVVGAMHDDDNAINAGAAYIFERGAGGPGNWGEVKKLTPSTGLSFDLFGYSVAVSGDTAVIGARGESARGIESGVAYVYERDEGGADNWGEVVVISPSDGSDGDEFGAAIALGADVAAVGSPQAGAGAVYIYERNHGGTDSWGEVKKLVASNPSYGDGFGTTVSVSAGVVLAGAQDLNAGGWPGAGAVFLYGQEQGGTDNWGEVAMFTASDIAAGDEFGSAVAISAETALVGAQGDDDNGSDSGSAYILTAAPHTPPGEDVGIDAGSDVGSDTGSDVSADVSGDVAEDDAGDSEEDVGVDSGEDVGGDTLEDVGGDAGEDIGDGVGEDTGGQDDVEVDAGDGEPDATDDTSTSQGSSSETDGCGCSAAGSPSNAATGLLALVGMLALRIRRRTD